MSERHRFDPEGFGTFRVVDRAYDPASRRLTLDYALDDGERFTETVVFESPTDGVDPADVPAFERALLHLHIAAGTSYYKTAAPPVVRVEGTALGPAALDFHHRLYDDGLREFAVANGLPVPRAVELRHEPAGGAPPVARSGTGAPSLGRIAVPIGGGKDSLVLIEALRPLAPRLFAVNPHPLVVELAERAGLELLVVRRRLSPRLEEVNRSGARNGHVPITAIVSLLAVAAGYLYGYDTIAMAIERSASEETVTVGGTPVNHQYSKSLECETALRALLAEDVDPRLRYGSALRPYSELAIARAFAGMSRYHPIFCSCNAAFRAAAGPGDRWCGECAKCRFVALVLAPFLDPSSLAAILGRDLFADPGQIDGFAALMSEEGKPFDCVGERRESAAAMAMLADAPRWRDAPVVRALGARAAALVGDAGARGLLEPDHRLDFPDRAVAAAVDRALAVLP
jgi:UDP-N-acetyl-alpha-D-muramoyl-L-alanyl-L-glutamate epimerase